MFPTTVKVSFGPETGWIDQWENTTHSMISKLWWPLVVIKSHEWSRISQKKIQSPNLIKVIQTDFEKLSKNFYLDRDSETVNGPWFGLSRNLRVVPLIDNLTDIRKRVGGPEIGRPQAESSDVTFWRVESWDQGFTFGLEISSVLTGYRLITLRRQNRTKIRVGCWTYNVWAKGTKYKSLTIGW